MLRIVGGAWRGRRLVVPNSATVRPTSDRARESLFNLISHGAPAKAGLQLMGAKVLDVCCGSGALGLEALSRGAAWAGFIDQSPDCLKIVQQNSAALGAVNTQLWCRDSRNPPEAPAPVELIFLDPPYASDVLLPSITALQARGWELPTTWWMIEVGAKHPRPLLPTLRIIDERSYGAARIIMARSAAGE